MHVARKLEAHAKRLDKRGLAAQAFGFHSEKTYRFCPIKSHRYDNIISRTGNVLLTCC